MQWWGALVIAVMGGAFDPVHFGHVKPALELVARPEIAQLRLAPCRVHADKAPAVAAPEHRLRMLELVAGGGLAVDARELTRDGVSYTADTLDHLRAEVGALRPLAFVAGRDVAARIADWERGARLPRLSHLIVLARPGPGLGPGAAPEAPSLPWRRARDLRALAARPAGLVYFMHNRALDISSTTIRAMIGRRREPRYLLPGAVWNYIRRHRLYGWDDAGDD